MQCGEDQILQFLVLVTDRRVVCTSQQGGRSDGPVRLPFLASCLKIPIIVRTKLDSIMNHNEKRTQFAYATGVGIFHISDVRFAPCIFNVLKSYFLILFLAGLIQVLFCVLLPVVELQRTTRRHAHGSQQTNDKK